MCMYLGACVAARVQPWVPVLALHLQTGSLYSLLVCMSCYLAWELPGMSLPFVLRLEPWDSKLKSQGLANTTSLIHLPSPYKEKFKVNKDQITSPLLLDFLLGVL